MAKARKRKRNTDADRRGRSQGRWTPPASTTVHDQRSASEAFSLLAEATSRGEHAVADRLLDLLAASWSSGAGVVAPAATASLAAAVTVAWEHGWQPVDLVHAFGRKLPAPDRRLLVRLVTAEGPAWRAHPHADPRWVDQVDELEADLGASAPFGTVVEGWASAEGLDAFGALGRAAELLALLWTTPALPPVGDPPSAWGTPRRRTAPAPASSVGGIDDRILARVRALLAKAESTEFAPEAEALTEKAQELMARYAIDQALVDPAAGGPGGDGPVSRRVRIDDPYAKGKATLLAEVADANRCQTVWSKHLGLSTVFGFATDLAVTDILYTSLVSQCSTAMQVASRDVASPRSFRESFVLAFGVHIGERLRAATAATIEEVESERGVSLLPVLAARDDQVEAARQQAFPKLRSMRVRTVDADGWDAGRSAAEAATLDAGTHHPLPPGLS